MLGNKELLKTFGKTVFGSKDLLKMFA